MKKACNEIITNTSSFAEFDKASKQLFKDKAYTSKQKGDYFEYFASCFFNIPIHKKIYDIKLYLTYPKDTTKIKALGLQSKDRGVDAVIVHTDNSISVVQIKERANYTATLRRDAINAASTEFVSIIKGNPRRFIYLFSNITNTIKNLPKDPDSRFKFILYSDLAREGYWSSLQQYVHKTPPIEQSYTLRDWQTNAMRFYNRGADQRYSIIAPCGAGKTVVGAKILEQAEHLALIIVPSLYLVGQWFESLCDFDTKSRYLLVGSDVNNTRKWVRSCEGVLEK